MPSWVPPKTGWKRFIWPWQRQFAAALERWLPERGEAPVPDDASAAQAMPLQRLRAVHLSDVALESVDAATAAVTLELRHLGRLSLEVICQALCLPADQLAFIKLNAELALADGWKSITKRKDPLPDADEWKDKPGKLAELVK